MKVTSKQVSERMKPKVKAFGFTKKELESVAATIANNLELEDNASEDDVNAAIDAQIDAVTPFLQIGQTMSNRVLQSYRDAHPDRTDDDDDNGDDDDDDDDDPKKKGHQQDRQQPRKKGDKQSRDDDESPMEKFMREMKDQMAAMSTQMSSMNNELVGMKADKVATTRKGRLEELLKDTGSFGQRTLRAFSRMTFKDDDEFDSYFEEVKADLDAYNQERANEGLDKLGTPPGGNDKPKEDNPISDADVEAIAGLY